MTENDIIGLFYERSEQAILELDRKYGNLCRRLACDIVNSAHDAEECVNDAYLGVWNAIPPARPHPLLPYVLKIVRNTALKSYWHSQAAKRVGPYTVALQEIEDCLADRQRVEDEIEARELACLVEGFLDTLSKEDRVIFLRRYWFADSYRDIAQRVGLSEKNVSVRLTRTRQKLKEYLTESGVFA